MIIKAYLQIRMARCHSMRDKTNLDNEYNNWVFGIIM